MEFSFHYVTDILSTVIGVELYIRSRVDDTVPNEKRFYVLLGALIGALIGSRLIAALENPTFFLHPPSFLYYYANKTVVGGIAGAIVGIEIIKKWLSIRVWTGDRTLMPLMIALIIGRVGCFFTGVQDGTVGGPCSYAWCLEQGDGILRHPNSLYEIIFVSLFLVGYIYVRKYNTTFFRAILGTRGASFRLFIILYFSLRFGIEFLKETHPLIGGLNSIQLVCLAVVLWYVRDLIRVVKTFKKRTLLV